VWVGRRRAGAMGLEAAVGLAELAVGEGLLRPVGRPDGGVWATRGVAAGAAD
jgi:hypothetical protein